MTATQTMRMQPNFPGAEAPLPCISMVLPFAPVMAKKEDLAFALKEAFDEVAAMVKMHYPAIQAGSLLNRLSSTIRNLNYCTHTRTVVIFVSPLIEKVYYLDIDMKKKIALD